MSDALNKLDSKECFNAFKKWMDSKSRNITNDGDMYEAWEAAWNYRNKPMDNGLPPTLADQISNPCSSHGPDFISITCDACMKAVKDFSTKTSGC